MLDRYVAADLETLRVAGFGEVPLDQVVVGPAGGRLVRGLPELPDLVAERVAHRLARLDVEGAELLVGVHVVADGAGGDTDCFGRVGEGVALSDQRAEGFAPVVR